MSEGVNTKHSAVDRREIRVFISSTFRDMQEEREELVKQIFPQLRRHCESRGVTWGEVDLRWGVPDEAKAEGKVLPLCLQEIEHCRPYFIGLLGERYGWVPKAIPQEVLETQPWIRRHPDSSVTALEILHGVLENPKMEKHAFFYFRDPAYAAAHPGFTEDNPTLREKLAKLKDDIRKSGFPVSEPFATPKQLGEWVLRDLTAIIEQLYPETSIPNALDRGALDHEAYSASRRTVYIARDEYIDRLNAHALGNGPPLVIAGESGGGKSALLANWTHNWSKQHPETPVLVHFIGAAPDSANWMAMLRRLLGEFQRKFGIQIEIPDQLDALRAAFANALHMVSAHGRLVLVLDALNQIEDRDGVPDLVWLPAVIPANVRLVVSTLPGRSWNDLKKRGWPVMTVQPLTVPEREELIVKYLKRYSKQLSSGPAHRIAAAPQAGNGLYLSTLLNELRQFGHHEELDKRIGWYLQAADPFELYGKVIQRWEQDYEEQGSGMEDLVGESLTRLWAARRGLSEIELLESLGTANSPLPRALWSPLYLAACDALVNRGGLLTFAHDFLREAVREAYLPTKIHQQAAHRALATYFAEQPLLFRFLDDRQNRTISPLFCMDVIEDAVDHIAPRPYNRRKIEEQLWQANALEEWETVAAALREPLFFQAQWDCAESDVEEFWRQIQKHTSLRMETVYKDIVDDPKRFSTRFLWALGRLLSENGRPIDAIAIQECIVERTKGIRAATAPAVSNLAQTLSRVSRQDEAFDVVSRVCDEIVQSGASFACAPLRFELGRIYFERDDFRAAIGELREASVLCRGGMKWSEELFAQILVLRGLAHGRVGELDACVRLVLQGVEEARLGNSRKVLAWALEKAGMILDHVGEQEAAKSLQQEARRIHASV